MKNEIKSLGEKLYNRMLEFIKIGWRRVGSDQARNACKYIVKLFNEFGLENVRLEPFEMLYYTVDNWELTLKSDFLLNNEIKITCHPVWHSKATDHEGIEAELIHIGFGTPKEYNKEDIKGKIVIVDSFRMMNFYPTLDFWRVYETARKLGAVGFIAIHDSPPNTIFVEYVSRHQTLKDSNLESGNIPALALSYEDGQYLKSLINLDKNLKGKIILQSKISPKMTDNIFAYLPGRKTDDIILIGTHTDSWFDGAIDNAGANAGFLELAEYYSKIPENERTKSIIFAGFAGHEVGSIGAIEFARKHKEILNKVSTFCMLDGFGSKGYILENPSRCVVETGLDESKGLFTTENQIIFDIIKDAVFKYHLFPSMHVSAVLGPFSDLGPFVSAKIPSFMIIGKGIFYHTIEDTADKILPNQLARTTLAHIDILNRINEIPSDQIREADRKSLKLPAKKNNSDKNNVYFNFNITPNPMIKGTTALIYITSFVCNNRIIVDLKWNINNKEIKSPIVPQRFGKTGKYPIKLSVLDNFGYEYSFIKYAYVLPKKQN